MEKENITDASRPNAGRVYDYMLGGYHNFEVDRQAAERIIKILPFFPKVARLQRWCLQDLAIELTEKQGFKAIVDFASGLPTNDHIHYVVPRDTTVIYSDWDPVVVEYAHDILKDTPNVYFFQADARRPEELLDRSEVQAILGGQRHIAVIYWGISAFLADEDISHVAHELYEWTDATSCWAFNTQGANMAPNDPTALMVAKIYEQMGSPLHPRSLENYLHLLRPWHPDEKGFVSLLEWHGFDQTAIGEDERQIWGAGGGGYGAYLLK